MTSTNADNSIKTYENSLPEYERKWLEAERVVKNLYNTTLSPHEWACKIIEWHLDQMGIKK